MPRTPRPLHRRRVVIAAAAAGLLLTACGTQFQDTPDDDAPSEDVTLTYWAAWNTGEPQQEIFDRIAADYTEATGVSFDVRYLGRDVTTNLINALGTGSGPDLFDAGTRNLLDFADRGFFADLGPLLEAEMPDGSGAVVDTLADGTIQAATIDDQLAILPTYVTTNGMWFNAARFPELVASPPATWDDFIDLLDAQVADGLVPVGADGSVSGYNVFWFYQSMMRTGGPGSLRTLAEDPAAWDEDHVLQSAQMVQQLVDGGYLQPDYMGTVYPAAQLAWANDDYSFMLNGSYMGGETQDQQVEGFEASTFPFPMIEDGYPTVELTVSGLAANADSENLEAATDFFAFAAQREYQELWASEAGFISAHRDVPAPTALQPLADAVNSADVITGSADLAGALHPTWWNDILLPLSDQLFSGALTAEEFVAEGREQTATYVQTQD